MVGGKKYLYSDFRKKCEKYESECLKINMRIAMPFRCARLQNRVYERRKDYGKEIKFIQTTYDSKFIIIPIKLE